MKDIDIVASMFEEIKKSLEKLSKQKPSSQPTAETLSEDIISLKKILKLIFDMQTKLYEAQQELPNALKQSKCSNLNISGGWFLSDFYCHVQFP